MLPSPRPGTSRDNLLKTLNERHTALVTLRGGVARQGAQAWILKYLEWVNDTVRDLSYQASAADVSRLVLTPGYDRLLNVNTMNSTDIGTQRVLNGMVSLEIDHRVEAFDAAIKALKDLSARSGRDCDGPRLLRGQCHGHSFRRRCGWRPSLRCWRGRAPLVGVVWLIVSGPPRVYGRSTGGPSWRGRDG